MVTRTLVVLIIAGIGTYLLRASLIVAFGRASVPAGVERVSRFVAPAVLAAIIAPALAAPEGRVDLFDLRLVAAVPATLVAVRTGSLAVTLAAGLGSYLLLDLLI